MFKQKKLLLLPIFFLSMSIEAKEISLDMLIDLAINNNSNIKISKYKQEIKAASLDIAQAGYYPKVSLTGEVAQYDIDSGLSQVNDTVKGLSLSANQLLYDFGKTSKSIESAEENFSASKEETIANISSTVLEIKRAYYNILKAQQQISLYEEMILIDKLRLEQVQAYHEAGIRTLIDVTDARLQLSNSKLKLLESKYSFKESLANIISIIGVDAKQSYEIKKDSNIIEIASHVDEMNVQLERLKESGLKNRPEIKLYEKQIDAQQYQLQSIRSEYYPSVELDAMYSNKDSDKIASLNTKQISAGVYLKWNVYTGNTTEANIKNNFATLSTLKQELFQQKLEIKKSIDIAYSQVKSSEESIKISFLTVELAAQKLDLAKQRYKAGISDSVELSDATLEYSESKNNLIDNYYNYLDAKAQLEYSIGEVKYLNL
ncbi:MAG: outer membrane protein [Sulfurimonas sp.]|jgi:outer membrane protein|uniref:TolC family protein n=1 Tax=Sulfurimonas sp. TaxID=2022749 RepID=UPI0039E21FF2